MRWALYVSLLLPLVATPLTQGQSETEPTPAEALRSAMLPIDRVRRQPDDLTEEDKIALTVGRRTAASACALTTPHNPILSNTLQVMELAKLCLFGERYDLAEQAAVTAVSRTDGTDKQEARLLLLRSFAGLQDFTNAADQALQIMRQGEVSAQMFEAIDDLLRQGSLRDGAAAYLYREICSRLIRIDAVTLRTRPSVTPVSSDEELAASNLVLACYVSVTLGEPPDSQEVRQAQAVLQTFATVQPSYTRSLLFLNRWLEHRTVDPPLRDITGRKLEPDGKLVSFSIPITTADGIYIPVEIWSRASLTAATELARSTHQTIYAVTSWHSNTGDADDYDRSTLLRLRTASKTLPHNVIVLIIHDLAFQRLFSGELDAVVLLNGAIKLGIPLTGETSERIALISAGAMSSPQVSPSVASVGSK